ncbi:hypothetical protein IQ268_22475 [Oculatella sp. LEGE 06141]|uniref:hypothetical protein n=1 Tax=Oculatella sp. LEGE 06141 TaxID=1828648 RepID=UPI001882D872|nr:hypothetical protein [Oculatella sp. LEGE 06141]MBE9181331.1 hypothetical protein [Oculatella sp. LEGE 06141]
MTQLLLNSPGATSAPACHPSIALPPERDPLKHLLIGSPRAIRHTIHLLHNLHYVEAGLWSPLIAIPNHQLIITPNNGDMMSLLLRQIQFQ